MNNDPNIANPGSTLGEAVGALVEQELNRLLRPIAEENSCVFLSAGRPNPKTGKATKLLLRDAAGNDFNIDAVIANERLQPLVLVESKYIRYKKHNRDKGSWICTAHYSLRRSYPSIRKSIAVLAGSWSGSSKALMRSFDVTLLEVDFHHIVQTLSEYAIDFNWGEKERDKALEAWRNWQNLSDKQYQEIGAKLLISIEPELRSALVTTLSSSVPRHIETVEITLETNIGETRIYVFNSLDEAVDFLQNFDADEILDHEQSPTLWSIDDNQ